jgi:uncharacterized protein
MPITSTYAAILSLLYVFLSVRVVGLRRATGVGLTDGGNKLLLRRIRVHANFAEYVPLAVILMILAESLRGPAMVLHLVGIMLTAGRIVHAYGLSQEPEILYCRTVGMALTFSSIVAGSIANLALVGVLL